MQLSSGVTALVLGAIACSSTQQVKQRQPPPANRPAPAYAWSGESYGSEHFRDVMTHTPPHRRWFKTGAEPMTIAHESHHGLQFAYSRPGHYRYFYFEDGHGIYVSSPRVGLRLLHNDRRRGKVYTQDAFTHAGRVRAHIPASVAALARSRYQVYLADPNRRTYGVLMLFDEWNAYVAGGRVAVEVYQNSDYFAGYVRREGGTTYTKRTGAVDGMVDFLVFCTAGVAALAQHEPAYLRNTPALKTLFIELATRTNKWMRAGLAIDIFTGFHAAKLYQHLQRHPDAAPLRRTLRQWIGATWTKQHLGF